MKEMLGKELDLEDSTIETYNGIYEGLSRTFGVKQNTAKVDIVKVQKKIEEELEPLKAELSEDLKNKVIL